MSMPSSSYDREALRRNLHAMLSDSLADVVGDVRTMNLPSLSVPSHLAHGKNQASTALGDLTGLFDSKFMPSVQQALLSHRVDFPQPTQASMPVRAASTPFGGLTSNEMILAAAASERRNFLDQARVALLKQQISHERERQLMRESYQVLLRDKLVTGSFGGLPKQFPSHVLPPAVAAVSPSLLPGKSFPCASNVFPSTSPESMVPKSTKALEALGSSLRQSTDPYIDVAFVEDPDPEDSQIRRTRGGVTEPFPEKLHRMLEETEKEGKTDVVSFFSHGRAFAVHDIDKFVADIMPRFFKQTKWNSFARQLNLYGFIRLTSGPDAGGYYHELFLKGRPNLCFHMRRVGVPQGKDRRKFKSQSKPAEPDFYSMAKVTTSS